MFGLLTIAIFATIGFLLLPMWLWVVAWIIKNIRYFILEFSSLSKEWVQACSDGLITIFNVIIYGEFERPEQKANYDKR
jgi:hypothetical protein